MKAPKGTLVLDWNGNFRYTPPPGFVGKDSFDYRASDGSASRTRTVNIYIWNPTPPRTPINWTWTIPTGDSVMSVSAGQTIDMTVCSRCGPGSNATPSRRRPPVRHGDAGAHR